MEVRSVVACAYQSQHLRGVLLTRLGWIGGRVSRIIWSWQVRPRLLANLDKVRQKRQRKLQGYSLPRCSTTRMSESCYLFNVMVAHPGKGYDTSMIISLKLAITDELKLLHPNGAKFKMRQSCQLICTSWCQEETRYQPIGSTPSLGSISDTSIPAFQLCLGGFTLSDCIFKFIPSLISYLCFKSSLP